MRGVASVASFFLSRIDVAIDPLLEEMIAAGGPKAEKAGRLRGEVAIACAKVAYEIYRELFGGARFAALAERGARGQRLLWASTGTKNPDYPDTKYVEPLIGPDTVNTMPLETIEAYRDHGDPAPRLQEGLEQAHATAALLAEVGIDAAGNRNSSGGHREVQPPLRQAAGDPGGGGKAARWGIGAWSDGLLLSEEDAAHAEDRREALERTRPQCAVGSIGRPRLLTRQRPT